MNLIALVLASSSIMAVQEPELRESMPFEEPPARQVQPDTPLDDGTATVAYSAVGKWLVRVDLSLSAGCYAYTQYTDGSTLRLSTDPSRGTVYFGIGNWRWRSLQEGQDYLIEVAFGDQEPWSGEATSLNLGANILFIEVPSEFLEELVTETRVGVSYNGKRIAYVTLEGAGDAVRELGECHTDVGKALDDPFAQ